MLTGANDCGKSKLLRLIELASKGSDPAQEYDVNIDRIHDGEKVWKQDPKIGGRFHYKVNDDSARLGYTTGLDRPCELEVTCSLAPEVMGFRISRIKLKDGSWVKQHISITKRQSCITFDESQSVGDVIDLARPNPLEETLLRAAFGAAFSADKLMAASESMFALELSRAQDRLDRALGNAFPSNHTMRIKLQPVDNSRLKMAVHVMDSHGGYTPLGARGSGIRKITSLAATLMAIDSDSQYVVLLLDEPETSLHADAQHFLRGLLEDLATKPTMQVIYSTHSAAMINTMRPQSVRLLERAGNGLVAYSTINNRPIEKGFLPVRSSLGLSAADSLLYAPVTIVVEGDTEALCMPILLRRLCDEGVSGFEDLGHILSQTCFLDGCGDSYEYICRMVRAQGSSPIVFLDGDKATHARKKAAGLPGVPFVLLDDRKEFEQIIPTKNYLEAIGRVYELDAVDEQSFVEWMAKNDLPPKMAYTKVIDRWLESINPEVRIRKPHVMKAAIECVPIASVDVSPLAQLVDNIRSALGVSGVSAVAGRPIRTA